MSNEKKNVNSKIYELNEVDSKLFTFSTINYKDEKHEKNKANYISYANYGSGQRPGKLTFKTGAIKMMSGGTRNPKFVDGEDNKIDMHIPIDETQQACVDLENFGNMLYKTLDKQKEKIVGKSYLDRFETHNPVRPIPEKKEGDDLKFGDDIEGENVVSDKKEYVKYKKFKTKLMRDFKTKEITTKFYEKLNGSKKTKKLNITKVSDLDKIIYGSTLTFICEISSIFATKKVWKLGGYTLRQLGYTIKVVQVLIERSSTGVSREDDLSLVNYSLFGDEESDDEDQDVTPKNNKKNNLDEKLDNDPDDNFDDDLNDLDKDDEVEVSNKSKPKKKPNNNSENTDDDDLLG